MKKRILGSQGLEVSEIGLGCMGMSEFYAGRDDAESEATIHHALDNGVTLLDTADMYGPHSMKSWWGGRFVRGRVASGRMCRSRRSSGSCGMRRIRRCEA